MLKKLLIAAAMVVGLAAVPSLRRRAHRPSPPPPLDAPPSPPLPSPSSPSSPSPPPPPSSPREAEEPELRLGRNGHIDRDKLPGRRSAARKLSFLGLAAPRRRLSVRRSGRRADRRASRRASAASAPPGRRPPAPAWRCAASPASRRRRVARRRQTLAAQPQHPPAAGSRRDRDLHVARQRRRPDLGAQHRLVERDRQIQLEVAPFDLEQRVRRVMDGDDRVASRALRWPGRPCPRRRICLPSSTPAGTATSSVLPVGNATRTDPPPAAIANGTFTVAATSSPRLGARPRPPARPPNSSDRMSASKPARPPGSPPTSKLKPCVRRPRPAARPKPKPSNCGARGLPSASISPRS